MKDEDEISKLIKAFPKDIAAQDKRNVLVKVNWQGSGSKKPEINNIEENEWNEVQNKDINNRASENINKIKRIKKIINNISYFLEDSLKRSLNHQDKIIKNTNIKIKYIDWQI